MEAISTLAAHSPRHRPTHSPPPNSCISCKNRLLAASSCRVSSRSRAWAGVLEWRRYRRKMRASVGGSNIANEVTEDSKFVPLDADDPVYGPPALLLIGFGTNETAKILQLLKDLDGEFLKVIHFTEDMISLTVWDVMHVQQQKVEALPIIRKDESVPRICILSGLSGEEILMFIDSYPETGLDPAIFAAMVPNSANKLLGEVIDEIMGDHEMMSSKQSGGS